LPAITTALDGLGFAKAGIRIQGVSGLTSFLSAEGRVGSIAASFLGQKAQPVRAVLFDKTQATNWALGWHQDRTVCVRRRIEADGFGPWSIKDGLKHVEPPFLLLEAMVTLRVHIDAAPETNAPLLIAGGSHKLGKIRQGDIEEVIHRSDIFACLAESGDVWAYSTPILHASKRAENPQRRRVLQIDYAAADLPGGLEWAGV
jgi:ectoine hydroxylase-related dioxygenase (phytanoyl-CoA dioxygenase family)